MKVVTLPAVAILMVKGGISFSAAFPGFESNHNAPHSIFGSYNSKGETSDVISVAYTGGEENTTLYEEADTSGSVKAVSLNSIGILPEKKCNAGFTRFGEVCRRNVSTPGIYRCPWKTFLEEDHCIETETVESQVMCPEGYFLKGTKCSKMDVRAADVVCSDEYVMENGVCIRSVQDELIQKCPKGYKFSVRGCLKKKIFPADLTCPPGYDNMHSKCNTTEQWQPNLQCSSGYNLKDGVCVQILTRTPKISCPKGYKSDGAVCNTYSKVEADVFCSRGNLSKHKCVVEMQISPLPECPSGYSLERGSCIRTITELPKIYCPSIGYHPLGDRCIKETVSKPDYVCPPGSNLSNDKCQHIIKDLSTSTCPGGYTFSDGECFRHEIGEAHFNCPFGYRPHDMNTCIKEQKSKPVFTCSSGELKGKECHKKEITETIQPCSPDKMGSPCAVPPTAPRLVCPKHSTMDTTGRCVSQKHVHSVPACPPGTIPNGKMCEKSSASPPRITCPLGYHEEAQQCTKYETTPPTRQCPEHMVLKRNLCFAA